MNNLRNRVQLIGNLGNDPEVKKLDSGKTMARMSIATRESYKDNKGKNVNNTQWHNLVLWNNAAIIAERYLKKGSEVAVEGRLSTRSYEDKEGKKRYVTEIVVNEITMLGKRKEEKE